MTLPALGSRLPDVTSVSVGELSTEDLREKAVSWLDLGRDLRAREYAEALVGRTPRMPMPSCWLHVSTPFDRRHRARPTVPMNGRVTSGP